MNKCLVEEISLGIIVFEKNISLEKMSLEKTLQITYLEVIVTEALSDWTSQI